MKIDVWDIRLDVFDIKIFITSMISVYTFRKYQLQMLLSPLLCIDVSAGSDKDRYSIQSTSSLS